MILIDSNVPMYLVGNEHLHTVDARRQLERAVAENHRMVTDAEALQEILSFDRHFDDLPGVNRLS